MAADDRRPGWGPRRGAAHRPRARRRRRAADRGADPTGRARGGDGGLASGGRPRTQGGPGAGRRGRRAARQTGRPGHRGRAAAHAAHRRRGPVRPGTCGARGRRRGGARRGRGVRPDAVGAGTGGRGLTAQVRDAKMAACLN